MFLNESIGNVSKFLNEILCKTVYKSKPQSLVTSVLSPVVSWKALLRSHLSSCTFFHFHGDREDRVHRRSPLRRGRSQNTERPGDTAVWSTATGLLVWAWVKPVVLLLVWSLLLWPESLGYLGNKKKDEDIASPTIKKRHFLIHFDVEDLRAQFLPSPLYPGGQTPQMKEPSVLLQPTPWKQGRETHSSISSLHVRPENTWNIRLCTKIVATIIQ